MPEANITKLDAQTFSVEGTLTMATVANLATQAKRLLSSASGEVSLDLQRVVRADSAALAFLIDCLRLAEKNNFKLNFQHLPGKLLTIAKVSELESVLDIG